MNSREALELLG